MSRCARLAVVGLLLASCASNSSGEARGTLPSRAAPWGTVPPGPPPGLQPVADVLDALHLAAARADGPAYFALFAPDAVFIGTDATERWDLPAFRAYCEPYFAKGQGWTYVPKERHLAMGRWGDVAWFDERLDNAKYGETRGSGVLVHRDGRWLIVQYVLSMPVPNEIAPEVVEKIRGLKR